MSAIEIFVKVLGNLKLIKISVQYSCIYPMVTTNVNGNGTQNGNGDLMVHAPAQATPIASFSQADRDEILNLIALMREKLPFLQDLTAEERKNMAGMGSSNRAFAGKVLEVTRQNDDFLPRSFNVEQLCADLETFDRLSNILLSLTQLCNLTESTAIAIGTQAYEQSLVAYRHAKASGHGSSLDAMMTEMGQRFAKKTRKKKENKPEVTSSMEKTSETA
jgi:hypothetical protein